VYRDGNLGRRERRPEPTQTTGEARSTSGVRRAYLFFTGDAGVVFSASGRCEHRIENLDPLEREMRE
jgi:hypothetical protein